MPEHKIQEMLQKFEANTKGRDFVVGDIHGEFEKLQGLLELIDFDKSKDRMFSVGDLVDRGPESLKCLRLVNEDWFIPCRGNHEDMMTDSIRDHFLGADISRSYSKWLVKHSDEEMREAKELAESIPYALEVQTKNGLIGICHAQPPTSDWGDVEDPRMITNMVWSRDRILQRKEYTTENVHLTFHGHTPVRDVTKYGNAIWLDTGAVFDRPLTCMDINTLENFKYDKDVYNLG